MESINTGYELRCVVNNHLNDERQTTTYCTECGSVLRIRYNEPAAHIQYPLDSVVTDPLINHPSTLKPLQRLSKTYGADLYAKLEYEHPTGCFKDRGSYIEVQKALELEAEAICLASTGNMAASVAAYACYFKIPCFVFVPEKTTDAKIAQATIYNANIIRIKGDFSTCEALCRDFAKSGNYYLAGDYVFREEGQKSFSYELLEQHGDDFDYLFVPVGCGTNFGA
ncbi:MAG: threonine synthase, partial [Balneolaceae bacterium]